MKKLLPFLFILLFISANSIAQVTNLNVNGVGQNFTLAAGDQLSWSYNVPTGTATYIDFWFDTDQNGRSWILPSMYYGSLLSDRRNNLLMAAAVRNVIPDMDGIANGQVSLQISIGLAPAHYIITFKIIMIPRLLTEL